MPSKKMAWLLSLESSFPAADETKRFICLDEKLICGYLDVTVWAASASSARAMSEIRHGRPRVTNSPSRARSCDSQYSGVATANTPNEALRLQLRTGAEERTHDVLPITEEDWL